MHKLACFSAALCAILLAGNCALAGPGFVYNWSQPGDDLALFSDNAKYQLNIQPVGDVAVSGSTDTTAANLNLASISGGDDTFTNKTFKLGVTIKDGPATSTALYFDVKFTSTVTDSTTNTDPATVSITAVTSNMIVINGDLFTITPTTFAFPSPVNGSIQFHINEMSDGDTTNPQPPPTSDTPEPSTMLLAGVGSAIAGIIRWKRRTNS